MRVIEVGCGPGAATREVATRVGATGYVLAIDRSAKAIETLTRASAGDKNAAPILTMCVDVADFVLPPVEERFDLAFAVRVGVLDGRHPAGRDLAVARIRAALTPSGRLFVDGGNPLREIELEPS